MLLHKVHIKLCLNLVAIDQLSLTIKNTNVLYPIFQKQIHIPLTPKLFSIQQLDPFYGIIYQPSTRGILDSF